MVEDKDSYVPPKQEMSKEQMGKFLTDRGAYPLSCSNTSIAKVEMRINQTMGECRNTRMYGVLKRNPLAKRTKVCKKHNKNKQLHYTILHGIIIKDISMVDYKKCCVCGCHMDPNLTKSVHVFPSTNTRTHISRSEQEKRECVKAGIVTDVLNLPKETSVKTAI